MAENPSEEKSLPASDKKLRDVRKKGQVTKSQDLVTAMVMVGTTLCILVTFPFVANRLYGLVELTTQMYQQPFETLWPRLVSLSIQVLVLSVLPIIFISFAMVVLTNIIVMKGVVFSGEPVRPKQQNINPVEGAKRIFSMRGIVEFLKSLIKIAVLILALVIVYMEGLPALMSSSYCGYYCMDEVFLSLMKPLVITALVIFIVVGLLDYRMQRWLFLREQRMTKSERKREQKDMHGDPQIRQARQRIKRELGKYGGKIGLENTSILIGAGNDWLVGVRYVKGETTVPIVTCRATPEGAEELMELASSTDLMVVTDANLARSIGMRSSVGQPIPDGTFQSVANILVATKILKP